MTVALMQFLLSFFLIGFIWAGYWSYLSVIKAWDSQQFPDSPKIGGARGGF